MTTITTVVGMFPLALGLELRRRIFTTIGYRRLFRIGISNLADSVYYSLFLSVVTRSGK